MSQTERKLIINTAGGAAANMKQKEIPSTKNDAQKVSTLGGFWQVELQRAWQSRSQTPLN